jgi:predicted transcriptional regulator
MRREQVSIQMDDELKAEINEIKDRDSRSFAEMSYILLKAAVKERKRLYEKNRNKTKAGAANG